MSYLLLAMFTTVLLALPLFAQFLEATSNVSGAEGYCQQAIKFQGQLKFDEAIALYKKATELAPNEPKYPFYLGTAYQAKHDLDSAIDSYKKACALDPKNTDYQKLLANAVVQKARPMMDIALVK